MCCPLDKGWRVGAEACLVGWGAGCSCCGRASALTGTDDCSGWGRASTRAGIGACGSGSGRATALTGAGTGACCSGCGRSGDGACRLGACWRTRARLGLKGAAAGASGSSTLGSCAAAAGCRKLSDSVLTTSGKSDPSKLSCSEGNLPCLAGAPFAGKLVNGPCG